MAEKGFGVKEINLIGASGTPTIESPNNLNLNAVNVAISTNVSIGGTLSVTGNVSVGGTLTYEDVTNIDSVGVITARSGVDVDDFISVGSNIHLGNAGVVTATTFSGSAASLTSIPAANITGTLPAISGANLTGITITPTNSDIQVVYTVTANGTSAYRFAGNGVVSTADDPDLYLIRGQKYRFINNSGGSHPFQIREASGGTAYSTGVTNNGASSGNIDFAPTYDSPAQLVYQCTSHSGMVGNIYLRDAAGGNINVGVTTFSGAVNVTSAAGTLSGQFTDATNSTVQIKHPSTGVAQIGAFTGQHLALAANNQEKLRITSEGRVGINRTSPASNSLLHIETTNTDSYNVSSAVTNPILTLGGNNSGAANRCVGLAFNGTASNGEAFITLVSESSTEANLHFGMRSGGSRGDRMRISRGGDIGAPSGNNIYNASDERLKENMIELTDGLSKIEELKPISFNWKDGWNKSLDGVTQYGFGAQTTKAVDEILVEPFGTRDVELNGETIENPLRVNEKYIIPLLVKAVQELSAEVAALKAK